MGIEPTQPSWFYLPHILANFKKQVHGDIAQLLHSKARPVLRPYARLSGLSINRHKP